MIFVPPSLRDDQKQVSVSATFGSFWKNASDDEIRAASIEEIEKFKKMCEEQGFSLLPIPHSQYQIY